MSVYLVGAGPGDPGLITMRGLGLVRSCDVLIYDRLVSSEVVNEAPLDALRIARNGLSQDAVNRLLVTHGSAGRLVVRLKGGDPFVFGRGGEEAIALSSQGIPFEVVPGVSSVNAVPASAGIPVTYRGVASQVTFVTGHSHGADSVDYGHLARSRGTLIFLMGLDRIDALADNLLSEGIDPLIPAAVISRGTRPDQRTVAAPLETIAATVRDSGLRPPGLIVVGDTVSLRIHSHCCRAPSSA